MAILSSGIAVVASALTRSIADVHLHERLYHRRLAVHTQGVNHFSLGERKKLVDESFERVRQLRSKSIQVLS
jgi:hypothetical protein